MSRINMALAADAHLARMGRMDLDCTNLVYYIVRGLLGDRPGIRTNTPFYRAMYVYDYTKPWSMVAALHDMLHAADQGSMPVYIFSPRGTGFLAVGMAHGAWHACQGWRRLPSANGSRGEASGHQFWFLPGFNPVVFESSREGRVRVNGIRAASPAHAAQLLTDAIHTGVTAGNWDVETYFDQFDDGVRAVEFATEHPPPDPIVVRVQADAGIPPAGGSLMDETAPKPKRKITIPWNEIRELAGTLLARGVSKDAIPDIVADGLDGLLDFDAMINGPAELVGDILEAIDRPLFYAAAKFIVSVVPAPQLVAFAKAQNPVLADTLSA